MTALYKCTLAVALALSGMAQAHSTRVAVDDNEASAKLIGAWRLVHIDSPGPDGKPMRVEQPDGMLIYTRDGHMSVQLMYRRPASVPSNEYVKNGYEASFGSYKVDEATHTVTHYVQGSITGDRLVGKDLPRRYEFTEDGRLVLRSTHPDEHWSVIWQHY